jgi:hypothetical protein
MKKSESDKRFDCLLQAMATQPEPSGKQQEDNRTSGKARAAGYGDTRTRAGLARFQVLGRDADRDLIRSVARRLAERGPEAKRLRTIVNQIVSEQPPTKGGIQAALRRSPLVGADLDLKRQRWDDLFQNGPRPSEDFLVHRQQPQAEAREQP